METSRGPRRLEIIRSCLACPARDDGLFCKLGADTRADLNAIRQVSACARGTTLFSEGQPPKGLFVMCSGSAKLTTCSAGGRSLIVGIARTGEVLGLSAVMSNLPYEVTAKALELTQVNFIRRDDFLRFLHRHDDVSMRVVEHLSTELRRAYRQVSRIALAPTARAKLAGLLLDSAGPGGDAAARQRPFTIRLTHHEIGELIGCSRETVARLLGEFRRSGLIHTKGAMVTIREPQKLEAML